MSADEVPVGPLSPSWTAGFRALGDNSGAFPPNTQGAVGLTELLTALSTRVKRQDRNGAQIGSIVSLPDRYSGDLYGATSTGIRSSAPRRSTEACPRTRT